MTLFYFSEDETCSFLKDSFDFFDQGNIESISSVLSEMKFSYADDQIGFIVPCSGGSFPIEVLEFFDRVTLSSDYFFAIVVEGDRASDSPRKFMSLCSKFGINLRYLNFVSEYDTERKLRDKGISFRSDVGMFVSHIHGIDLRNRFFGLIESISLANKFMGKPSFTSKSQNETD